MSAELQMLTISKHAKVPEQALLTIYMFVFSSWTNIQALDKTNVPVFY